MKTFDDIAIRRPALAQSYLSLLQAEPGRPLALFAPRRVGKTFFLDHDLAPEAESVGLLPVYADLWLNQSAPLDAINHALEEKLDELSVPHSRAGQIGQTPVKKVGALGFSLDLGEAPALRDLPEAPALRLDTLIHRLSRVFNGQILLLLDEVQTLAEAADGAALIASLRAVLHKQRKRVCAVFTGSSQEALALLVNTAGGPMYQFAQIINFPFLGDEYLAKLIAHFRKVHPGKDIELEALRAVFQKMGFKPALMRDLIKTMSAEGITDPSLGLRYFMRSEAHVAIWSALLNATSPYERGVLELIARGMPIFSREAIQYLSAIPGQKPTLQKTRTAVDRLRKQGILTKSGASASIEDHLFAEYLLESKAQKGGSL